jgi:hypothetical protein
MIKAIKTIAQRRLELRIRTLQNQGVSIERKCDLLRHENVHAKANNDTARVTELTRQILVLDEQHKTLFQAIRTAGDELWPIVKQEFQQT